MTLGKFARESREARRNVPTDIRIGGRPTYKGSSVAFILDGLPGLAGCTLRGFGHGLRSTKISVQKEAAS